jgi:SAM-dependent methyltransferase
LAFDEVAPTYDASFGLSPTGRLFRFRVAERLMATVKPRSRVLDLGCGTGEDALWLAGLGYVVHGIDVSPAMVAVAVAKASRTSSAATFECRSLESLQACELRFDAVLSNLGALNCVPLETWTGIVPGLLARDGRGFVVLMGDRPLPEAFRSGPPKTPRGPGAPVSVGNGVVTTYYAPVSAVVASLSIRARVAHVEALGCLVPGPTYAGFPRRHPLVTGLLAVGESVLRSTPFLRGRGDHTLFEFTPR